jgi:predicted tellurium resistance membrane protein TerC
VSWLKIVGALLLLWIGIKLLQPEEEGHSDVSAATSLAGAIKTIIVADAVMSLDNVIAVAAAAHGSMLLVVFGILVSIPIVVWGSQLVLKLMDRYPIVITAGGALLGWIGGGMIVSDPALPADLFAAIPYPKYVLAALGALLVVALGKWLAARTLRLRPARAPEDLLEVNKEN